MIRVKITTPDAYWDTIRRKLKRTVEEGIQDVARLAATKAATATFPRGVGTGTKDTLQKAIYKDINRSYVAVDRKGKMEKEDGEYLMRSRTQRGRVPHSVKRKFIQRADYDQIRENLVKRAGLAKKGWIDCAKKLRGNTRIPVWLRGDHDLGKVYISVDGVTITNMCEYSSYLITDSALLFIMRGAWDGLIKQANKVKL